MSVIRFRRSLAALIVAAGASVAMSAVAQDKITVGYTSANTFMPAFVAKEQGYFEKHGLNVELQRVPNGSALPGALMSESLEIGTLTAPVFLQAVEGGIAMQIVANASLQSKDNPTAAVVAREGLEIKQPSDFKGKKVGVPGLNGVMHISFQKWLKDKGVEPNQVTYIEASFPQMGDMLKGGQIDGAVPVEPFLGRIKATKAGHAVASLAPDGEPYLESFYAATKKWAEANPKAVEGFRAALKDAIAYIESNTKEARETQVKYLGLPPQVVQQGPLATFSVDTKVEQMAYWIDVLKDFGQIKGTVKAEDVVAK